MAVSAKLKLTPHEVQILRMALSHYRHDVQSQLAAAFTSNRPAPEQRALFERAQKVIAKFSALEPRPRASLSIVYHNPDEYDKFKAPPCTSCGGPSKLHEVMTNGDEVWSCQKCGDQFVSTWT